MASATTPAATPIDSPKPPRLASIDAYRGLVMLLMMGEVLNFCRVSDALPGNPLWSFLCHHQSHVEWIGCSLHDLIQPSFSFLVGVALPFSLASRLARGESVSKLLRHALSRSVILILLGVFLRSIGKSQTNWTFEDTLSQIGFGYTFLFLLAFRPRREQWIAFSVLVIGYWASFALYPLPGTDFDYSAVGVPNDWPHLMTGFAAHWNKNSNAAWAFDTWFLNLFPRQKHFAFNGGGYCTLSFVPTLATMILGLIAGGVLRSSSASRLKPNWFFAAGIIGLIFGALAGVTGLCPVVKRIWSPSWVLFSGGWCFMFLGAFYLIIDVWAKKRWAFPLVVIGANSIAAYLIAHLFEGFVSGSLRTNIGNDIFKILGDAYQPLLQGAAILFIFWLMLWWLYKNRIFIKI